jgi:hypothetical protein
LYPYSRGIIFALIRTSNIGSFVVFDGIDSVILRTSGLFLGIATITSLKFCFAPLLPLLLLIIATINKKQLF